MTPKKVALITGITGQDGAYLAELLLKKGYEVHGIKRRASLFNTDRIDHLYQDPHVDNRNFILHYGDMTDSSNLIRIVQQVQPDEIYNLAAQSHVAATNSNRYSLVLHDCSNFRSTARLSPRSPAAVVAHRESRTDFSAECVITRSSMAVGPGWVPCTAPSRCTTSMSSGSTASTVR